MTRYVNHKHGLTIGSGNIFFLTSDDGVFRDHYKAWVIPHLYNNKDEELARYSRGIMSPAVQLIWEEVLWDANRVGDYMFSPAMEYWLNENIGPKMIKWDARKYTKMISDSVFFQNRNDAVKFVNFLKKVIGNAKFDK